jgi:hypothetical protein
MTLERSAEPWPRLAAELGTKPLGLNHRLADSTSARIVVIDRPSGAAGCVGEAVYPFEWLQEHRKWRTGFHA